MTTTNGTYMFCDADLSFSMALTCTGPSCDSILSYNGLTCTQSSSSSWDCTNGVKCAGATGFISKFTTAETNSTVSQTQNVSLNGTSFVFQQDGAGNTTLSNGTNSTSSRASSTTVSSTATVSSMTSSAASSPSASASSSMSFHRLYSHMLLISMVILSMFLTQVGAQVTASSIGNSINSIFQGLDKAGDGKSLFNISASAIAGEFDAVAVKTCTNLSTQDVSSLTGLPFVYGQCEEAMIAAEMSLIGSSLSVTLFNYTGLGGVLTSALTAAEESTVITIDAGAIPELFHLNSALCGLLVAVIQHAVLNPSSENLCAALESAVVSHEVNSSTSATSAIATPISTSTSNTASQATATASGTLPAGFTSNKCLECFLNKYFDSLQVLSAETCNNAPVIFASAYDLSGIFCDPGITSSPSSTAFCSTLCANPCAKFDVATIMKDMGTDYIANPASNPDQLGKLCNTCSSTDQVPADYQCKQVPTCLCGIGTQLCAKGCTGVA